MTAGGMGSMSPAAASPPVTHPPGRPGVHVVLGAPGTGKSTRVVEEVVAHLEAGGDLSQVLVLTPSRLTATMLRERLEALVGHGVLEVREGRPWMRPLLGTGLCGGFTTMSTVVLGGSAMIGADFPLLALLYAALTLALCLGAVVLGLLLGNRLGARGLEATDGGAA